jgi:uncharacterized protein YkwD
MIERDYFSHDTKVGKTFDARLRAFGYDPGGYRYYAIGENIACGSGPYGESSSRMDACMKSDGHRPNNLNGEFRESAWRPTREPTQGPTGTRRR